MKKTLLPIVILALMSLVASCAATGGRAAMSPYIEGGINVHFRGDRQLNLYQGAPHALTVCAYQLRDLNGFNQVLEEKEGVARLMECSRFDPSVNFAKRLVVQPGRDLYDAMEVSEGTRHVAIVAGYYGFKKKDAVKTMPLPLKGMPFFKKPGGTDISVFCGPQELRILKGGES
ncbi:MAG: type VI secretion system lipoprotein TssJ [Syntrophaceae bacterium]|nr:type VI secretion system lipoprotein TssJ [Syntrophaceae bacterium]